MVSLKTSAHETSELALPFPDCGTLKNGSHMEAFFNYQDICVGMMNQIREKPAALKFLISARDATAWGEP